MSGSHTVHAGVREYLDAVHRHLVDLRPEDRADLISPVEQRVIDLGAADGGDEHIERHFGTPAQLAAELRTAAGYPPPPTGRAVSGPVSTTAWLGQQASRPAAAAVITYLTSLRPAWWAVRGYLLVGGVLAVSSQGGGYRLHTMGSYKQALLDTTEPHLTRTWLLIPVLAVLASIVLGHLTPRLRRPVQLLVVGLNAAAIVTLLAYPTWWMGPAFAFFSGLVT